MFSIQQKKFLIFFIFLPPFMIAHKMHDAGIFFPYQHPHWGRTMSPFFGQQNVFDQLLPRLRHAPPSL
ncbi:hypothetical protein BDV40DRAFT_253133, partial [Aspergillus tamarii]